MFVFLSSIAFNDVWFPHISIVFLRKMLWRFSKFFVFVCLRARLKNSKVITKSFGISHISIQQHKSSINHNQHSWKFNRWRLSELNLHEFLVFLINDFMNNFYCGFFFSAQQVVTLLGIKTFLFIREGTRTIV